MELEVLFKYSDLFQSRSSTVVHILRCVSGRVKSKWSFISSKADLGGGSGSNAAVAKGGGSNGAGSKAAVVKGGGNATAGGTRGGPFVVVGKGVGKAPACVQVVELVKSDALNVCSVLDQVAPTNLQRNWLEGMDRGQADYVGSIWRTLSSGYVACAA